MASTRLPGKVLKRVLGKPLLQFLVERLKRSRLINELVIATTTSAADDEIVACCNLVGVAHYRGSEVNVLSRYAEAASLYRAEVVVRICCDSPLLDPLLVDQFIGNFQGSNPPYDYLSNTINQSYPLGMNVEVFSRWALEQADMNAKRPYEREHVTPYIYFNPERFVIHQEHSLIDLGHLRLTVDVPEDFELVKLVLEALYPNSPEFGLGDILAFYRECPEVFRINSHVMQKRVPCGPALPGFDERSS